MQAFGPLCVCLPVFRSKTILKTAFNDEYFLLQKREVPQGLECMFSVPDLKRRKFNHRCMRKASYISTVKGVHVHIVLDSGAYGS